MVTLMAFICRENLLAIRVFELARELDVTSKIMLEKCRAEGLEIKNHMSTLSAGLEATVREWFSEDLSGGTAVEKTEHVDLKAARKEASKSKRRKGKKKEEIEQPEETIPVGLEEKVTVEVEEVEVETPKETQQVVKPT